MTDYSQLTDTEIDTAMAGMMGWMHSMNPYWTPREHGTDELVYLERNWHPHNDLNQVWKCEEKLLKLKDWVLGEYETNLGIIVDEQNEHHGQFSIIHATARQKCEAMLMAMESVK